MWEAFCQLRRQNSLQKIQRTIGTVWSVGKGIIIFGFSNSSCAWAVQSPECWALVSFQLVVDLQNLWDLLHAESRCAGWLVSARTSLQEKRKTHSQMVQKEVAETAGKRWETAENFQKCPQVLSWAVTTQQLLECKYKWLRFCADVTFPSNSDQCFSNTCLLSLCICKFYWSWRHTLPNCMFCRRRETPGLK